MCGNDREMGAVRVDSELMEKTKVDRETEWNGECGEMKLPNGSFLKGNGSAFFFVLQKKTAYLGRPEQTNSNRK